MEEIENKELDRLLHNALSSDDALKIPSGLADLTIQKLERKLVLRELIFELSIKISIVIGSLAILATVFALLNGTGVLTGLYVRFINNWQIIASVLLLVFITIIIDQVVVRFYNYLRAGNVQA